MQPLLIGSYDLGVQRNVEPFMLPEVAFPDLLNTFVWRNRVKRKAGFDNLGRLSLVVTAFPLGVTDGAGNISGNILTALLVNDPLSSIAPGSITVTIGVATYVDNGAGVLSGGPGTGTINYLTGAITITGGPALTAATVTFSYYPSRPVMGIRTYEQPQLVNQEFTIFFDTRYAYRFTGAAFTELPSTLPTVWTGSDSQFFWTTNFQYDTTNQPLFWATNNNPGLHNYQVNLAANPLAGPPPTIDVTTTTPANFQVGDTVVFVNMTGSIPSGTQGRITLIVVPNTVYRIAISPADAATIGAGGAITGIISASRLINQNLTGDAIRVYNGTTWQNFNPAVDAVTIMETALMLVPYKDRLVALSVTEGNQTSAPVIHRQRIRWSQNGSAFDGANGWRSDIVGFGGDLDVPTGESIISCGFVKDQLVIYCERSTWILLYNGNEALPFILQRVNSELGASSTFSAVVADNGLFCFGNVGVHQSNGQSTARIDQVIPDEIFNARASGDGPVRTYGIRDYFQEIVYWAYPNSLDNTDGDSSKVYYPNTMMIYNYRNNTFSFFDDNATCFGYFQATTGETWAQLNYLTWQEWTDPWNTGALQAEFPDVAFGNQQGFIELIDADTIGNDVSLYITAIVPDVLGVKITSPQHNLFLGQYVRFSGITGITLTNTPFTLNGFTYKIIEVVDANNFVVDVPVTNPLVGVYAGAGEMEVISLINILTKQFAPFWEKGNRYELKYIDMLFNRTTEGELDVDVFIDFDTTTSMTPVHNGVLLGLPVISTAPEGTNQPYYSFQQLSKQIWKRFYTSAMGETFQVGLSLNDTQMRSTAIATSDIQLHGMLFHFEQTGAFY